jgi:serralysin
MKRMANKLGPLRALSTAAAAIALLYGTTGTSEAYVPDDRWSITASGTTGANGTPITLTWSLVPDGTNIPGEGASNLVAYFDELFDVTNTSGALTNRPWFDLFEESFDRWSELGGITFRYEPNDNGSTLQSTAGSLGTRGDVRIGGAFIDGASSTLAYTWLPNSGDMVIDTGETSFYSNSANNYRAARNTIMHELGHAFGLLHIESSTDNLLMEPFINTSFDGPQLDDIRGIQGLYGDALEKTNGGLGNGTYQRATSLGALASGGTLSIGSDAFGGQAVGATETDFVSIANSSDVDFFSFTVAAPSLLDVALTPLGGMFSQGVEGGAQSSFDANSRNDLSLAIFAANGTTLLASANLAAVGAIETLTDIALAAAGTYFARVTGASANVQLYELELSAATMLVELAGDYNVDGRVDALDYTIWRNMLGSMGSNLAADGNNDGRVDAADYAVWKTHYGEMSAGSGGLAGGGAVPEPPSIALAAVAIACLIPARRRA